MFFAKPQQKHDCLLAGVKGPIRQLELWITELLLHSGLLQTWQSPKSEEFVILAQLFVHKQYATVA